ncbi:hypothetical protein ACFOUP_18360 [Belliella kenyensis]|uniref:AbiEi antitoxin C-terminal domain-containing protein n=1 Tax=Belliella kenyensis TaxID=1472724 RepID=A0ABV8ETM1_9BACT|nr:hypothetical protein [Belliella kenyensis]MCH7402256.1 hypothetical protein [Belliella kenyensis]MDN3601772.1 hypothetical protein [Belliella kenyensis]
MARKSRFIISESSIKKFFLSGKKVFSETELNSVLEENRVKWNLPISMNGKKFINKLIESDILRMHEVVFSGYLPNKTRYLTNTASVFDLAISLTSKAYLSHYTAAFLLGLTNQVPKSVYLTSEQSPKNKDRSVILHQQDIDKAFNKSQRTSNVHGVFGEYTIIYHNGMYTNKAGVFSKDGLTFTNVERTLIDLAVRPVYGGGVFRVLEIFENSIGKLSVNKLKAILDKLGFVYPYHQAIGFYLEKAGLDQKRLSVFLEYDRPNKFYLTYDMKEIDYNEKWNIFYPKGM